MTAGLSLLKSRIRRDLLALLFTNPQQEYYLRELERRLDFSAGSLRRELLRLVQDGLLATHRKGNLLFYRLDQKYPLYREIKSIVAKTLGIEGALKKELALLKNIQMAFIYGSFARQTEKAASDIDLMIIGNPDTSRLNEAVGRLEKKLGREINFTIYAPAEYLAKKKNRNGFITELLRSPKILLIGKLE